jgi:putative Mg2+ transporter-C (MgtC) family protein
MMTSIYLHELYIGTMSVDPGRIASGVVTGIGFLGAGAIIRDSGGVKGLTTAASVWVASGIGLAVGCGFLLGAAFTTFISFLTLAILKKIEKSI